MLAFQLYVSQAVLNAAAVSTAAGVRRDVAFQRTVGELVCRYGNDDQGVRLLAQYDLCMAEVHVVVQSRVRGDLALDAVQLDPAENGALLGNGRHARDQEGDGAPASDPAAGDGGGSSETDSSNELTELETVLFYVVRRGADLASIPTPVDGVVVVGAVLNAPLSWREEAFLPDKLVASRVLGGDGASITLNSAGEITSTDGNLNATATGASGTDGGSVGVPTWALGLIVGIVVVVLVIVVPCIVYSSRHKPFVASPAVPKRLSAVRLDDVHTTSAVALQPQYLEPRTQLQFSPDASVVGHGGASMAGQQAYGVAAVAAANPGGIQSIYSTGSLQSVDGLSQQQPMYSTEAVDSVAATAIASQAGGGEAMSPEAMSRIQSLVRLELSKLQSPAAAAAAAASALPPPPQTAESHFYPASFGETRPLAGGEQVAAAASAAAPPQAPNADLVAFSHAQITKANEKIGQLMGAQLTGAGSVGTLEPYMHIEAAAVSPDSGGRAASPGMVETMAGNDVDTFKPTTLPRNANTSTPTTGWNGAADGAVEHVENEDIYGMHDGDDSVNADDQNPKMVAARGARPSMHDRQQLHAAAYAQHSPNSTPIPPSAVAPPAASAYALTDDSDSDSDSDVVDDINDASARGEDQQHGAAGDDTELSLEERGRLDRERTTKLETEWATDNRDAASYSGFGSDTSSEPGDSAAGAGSDDGRASGHMLSTTAADTNAAPTQTGLPVGNDAMLQMFDTNGDGIVTDAELQAGLDTMEAIDDTFEEHVAGFGDDSNWNSNDEDGSDVSTSSFVVSNDAGGTGGGTGGGDRTQAAAAEAAAPPTTPAPPTPFTPQKASEVDIGHHLRAFTKRHGNTPRTPEARAAEVKRLKALLKGHESAAMTMTVILDRPSPSHSFGFGLAITEEGHYKVASVKPDGLAADTLRVADIMLKINGQPLDGMSMDQIVKMMVNSGNSLMIGIERPREVPDELRRSSLSKVDPDSSVLSRHENAGHDE